MSARNIGKPGAINPAAKELVKPSISTVGTTQPLDIQPPLLEQIIDEFDKQASRFYNSLNSLDAIGCRLEMDPQGAEGTQPTPTPQTRLDHLKSLIATFNHLNNRLDYEVDKLFRII